MRSESQHASIPCLRMQQDTPPRTGSVLLGTEGSVIFTRAFMILLFERCERTFEINLVDSRADSPSPSPAAQHIKMPFVSPALVQIAPVHSFPPHCAGGAQARRRGGIKKDKDEGGGVAGKPREAREDMPWRARMFAGGLDEAEKGVPGGGGRVSADGRAKKVWMALDTCRATRSQGGLSCDFEGQAMAGGGGRSAGHMLAQWLSESSGFTGVNPRGSLAGASIWCGSGQQSTGHRSTTRPEKRGCCPRSSPVWCVAPSGAHIPPFATASLHAVLLQGGIGMCVIGKHAHSSPQGWQLRMAQGWGKCALLRSIRGQMR